MKGLKFLVLPVLASLLLPLGNVHAALDLGDTVDSVVQEVESVLGESDITIDNLADDSTAYEYDAEYYEELDDFTLGAIISVIGLWLILGIFLLFIPLYIYRSITLMQTGKKLGYENSWFAWIPVLNLVMLYQLGGLSPWFILVNFIPVVTLTFTAPLMLADSDVATITSFFRLFTSSIVSIATTIIGLIAYMRISEKRGYDKWLGLLNLVPIANLVLIGILAWGKGKDEA